MWKTRELCSAHTYYLSCTMPKGGLGSHDEKQLLFLLEGNLLKYISMLKIYKTDRLSAKYTATRLPYIDIRFEVLHSFFFIQWDK